MSPALLLVVALQANPRAEILDFTAVWCGPCQTMAATVSKLERDGVPIRKVDVDRHPELARQYRIASIPAFVLVVDGREVGRVTGAKEGELRHLAARVPKSAEGGKSPFPWPFKKSAETTPAGPLEPPAFPERPDYRAQNESAAPTEPAVQPNVPRAARDPIETAVRIRVKDTRGTDCGSGTVIASKPGKALVLTCWHIFRDFGKDAAVEVDLFPDGPQASPETLSGTLIKFDEEADVALVGIDGCGPLAVSPLVPSSGFPKQGDHVFSVGCGNGEPPSKLQHTVTRINPFEGPQTTECTAMPVVGRSGGGLFDRQGRVIGVCFAAHRESKTGVYAGAAEIHELMHTAGYAKLVPADGGAIAQVDPPSLSREDIFDDVPQSGSGAESGSVAETGLERREPEGASQEPRPQFEPNGGNHDAAIADLEAGAEVICTIRPREPGAPSEVIVINRASRRFLRYLRGELEATPVETSMRVDGRGGDGDRAVKRTEKHDAYVRLAAAHIPPAGVALLSRVFHNHGRP